MATVSAQAKTTKKRQGGFVGGCIVPIATVLGMMLLCFALCYLLFALNQATTGTTG